jgi:Ribbon-helix-helix protein, copG family
MARPLRAGQELDAAVTALAAAEGASRQEIIRRGAFERYERHSHIIPVQESSNRLNNEWAEVVARLGNM